MNSEENPAEKNPKPDGKRDGQRSEVKATRPVKGSDLPEGL